MRLKLYSFVRSTICYALLALTFSLCLSACKSTPAAPAQETLRQKQIRTLKEHGFVYTDDGWALSFAYKMLFDTNQAVLKDQSREAVRKISMALLSVGLNKMRIEGHADATGRESYNVTLSEQRAWVVADAVIKSGIPKAGILVRGMGSHIPVASNDTEAGRAENRRVSIIVVTD